MTKTLEALLTHIIDKVNATDSTNLSEETLHVLNGMALQETPVADAAATKTERNPTTTPYKWGPSANQFKWNEGMWS